jgi:hypothetical protein
MVRFGPPVDILTGTETEKVRARGHDRLPTFGVGTEFDRKGWQAVFRQMMGHDLVRPDPARHGALRMTEAARPILKGEAGITLRKDTLTKGGRRPAAKALVSEEDAPLLSALKAKRRALAEAARVPAYVIFTDRTLIEMAETRPQSLDEIARISGVGATKLERYGAPSSRSSPARRRPRPIPRAASSPDGRRARSMTSFCRCRPIWRVATPGSTSRCRVRLHSLRNWPICAPPTGKPSKDCSANAAPTALPMRFWTSCARRASSCGNPTRDQKGAPMLTVISPAKRLDWSPRDVEMTEPAFQDPTPMRWPRWPVAFPPPS